MATRVLLVDDDVRLGAREMLVKPVRPAVLVKSLRKFTGGA